MAQVGLNDTLASADRHGPGARIPAPAVIAGIAAALPGIGLAVGGILHPDRLTAANGELWRVLHLVLLPVFPLLGLALFFTVRGAARWTKLLLAVFVFGYAVIYNGMNAISGIAAPILVGRTGRRTADADQLFVVGNDLGFGGALGFLLAVLLVVTIAVLRFRGPAVIPAALLILAAVSFLTSHIYFPRGVFTVAVAGIATGWLAFLAYARYPSVAVCRD